MQTLVPFIPTVQHLHRLSQQPKHSKMMLYLSLLLVLFCLSCAVNGFRLHLKPGFVVRSFVRASTPKSTFSTFDEFLQTTELPILVDFYAEWCGPCKKMKVELSEVASKLENVIKVAKVDTDRAPKLSAKYEVHALPTLILFSNGEVVEKFEGYRPADEVETLVKQAITRMNARE